MLIKQIQWVKISLLARGEKLNLTNFLCKHIGARFGEISPGENFPIYGSLNLALPD